TTPREVLPAATAQYFLQAINQLAADGALIVFLNRRKSVKWLTAAWTMMFQGLIDLMMLSGVATAAGLLVPHSAIRYALPYAGGVFGFLVCVALWWAWGKPKTRPERWMYGRPSAKAFREAGLREYVCLGGIRLSLMVAQGFLFYYSFVAFVPKVPLVSVLALTPGMLAAFNQPITPAGLGPLQAIVVGGLSHYASSDKILAAALGISIMHLLCRLPLGLGAAGTFARRVLAIEAAQSHEDSEAMRHADAMN
ncbi:MAG: lysylphosphatidylglycerol synthase domain-containing protein, partial [Candidatus Binataceae bacterium]